MDLSIKQHSTHAVDHDSRENEQPHQDRDDNQSIKHAKTTYYRHQDQHANGSYKVDDNHSNSPHPSKSEDRNVLPEKRVRFVADIDDHHDSSKRSSQNNHIKVDTNVSIEGNLVSNMKADGKSMDKATNTASTLCNGEHNRQNSSSSSTSPSSPPPNQSSSHSAILLDHEVHDANWLHQAHHHEVLQVTCHGQVSHQLNICIIYHKDRSHSR